MTNKSVFAAFLLLCIAVVSCNPGNITPDTPTPVDPVTYHIKDISEMSLWEKVGQMFMIIPYDRNGDDGYYIDQSAKLESLFSQYPVGGFLLKAENIKNPEQIIAFTSYLHTYSNYPVLTIDEEGGSVARIARNSNFNVKKYDSAYAVGSSGNANDALSMGMNIGTYLHTYGFDVDFAPVADVWTNPKNTVIGKRAFSSDPNIAAKMVDSFLLGLNSHTVGGCLKHFPGHGDTTTDSHYGYASTSKTWEEMLSCEMIPFKKAIDSGAQMVMTAHISAPAVTGSEEPATVSYLLLTGKLRGELGFKGVIITDSMGMGAISKQFDPATAAIKAIQAGVDIVLNPGNFESTYNAVYTAVQNGTIPESRIDESVNRILTLKRNILTERKQLAGSTL